MNPDYPSRGCFNGEAAPDDLAKISSDSGIFRINTNHDYIAGNCIQEMTFCVTFWNGDLLNSNANFPDLSNGSFLTMPFKVNFYNLQTHTSTYYAQQFVSSLKYPHVQTVDDTNFKYFGTGSDCTAPEIGVTPGSRDYAITYWGQKCEHTTILEGATLEECALSTRSHCATTNNFNFDFNTNTCACCM